MERLTDELLLLILDQLAPHEVAAGAARVCRRWAALAERRALHVRRRADLPRVHAGLRALLITARLPALHAALAVARRLRSLTVHAGYPLADVELAALRRLPHLAHLDVFLRARVADERLLPAAERLVELVLNETVAPGVLRALAGARRLRALHMFGRAQYYPRRELVALLAARRDHLTALTLRCAELPDKAYAAIGACPNLMSLQLYACWLLTPAGAVHVARPPLLRRLHVTGARMLRPRALAAWLRALPAGLLELDLSASWFGDQHVPDLAARLPGLHALELWRCRVTACGVAALAAALPHLRDLDTDVPLAARAVAALHAHPVLERLRCMPLPPPLELLQPAGAKPEPVVPRSPPERAPLAVRAADAVYALKCLRGSCEGLRADLFYYWMQGVELELAGEAEPCSSFSLSPSSDDDLDDITWFNTFDPPPKSKRHKRIDRPLS